MEGGGTEAMCMLRRDQFDTRIWDVVSLTLLYLLPLALLSLLYARIAQTLWRSGQLLASTAATNPSSAAAVAAAAEYGTFKTQHTASVSSTSSSGGVEAAVMEADGAPRTNCRENKSHVARGSVKSIMSTYVSMASMRDEGSRVNHASPDIIPLTPRGQARTDSSRISRRASPRVPCRSIHLHPSPLVLRARRNVINMLVVVVVSFAACSLPFHTRKMLQYYWASYNHNSDASYILTPVTFLLMYANSAVNPILYTFMSRKFRTSSRDLLTCRLWQARPRPPRPTVVARLIGRDKVVTHLV